MGLLDQVLGGVGLGGSPNTRSPGVGGAVAAGVLLALAVKAARSYQASHPGGAFEGRSFDPANPGAGGQAPAQQGGLGGMLGGLLGGGGGGGGGLGGMLGGAGGGLGGLLGGLGGAGALGSLISQLQQKGFGNQVNSWVAHGENRPLAPQQLADALGEDTVQQLQDHTGMPRDALLTDLARELPKAVDEATPQGRPPTDEELHQIAAQPPTATT